jgi:hypothetical protein
MCFVVRAESFLNQSANRFDDIMAILINSVARCSVMSLKLEAICSSRTLVTIYQITRNRI